MTVFNVIALFGGLALFLYGMQTMGDALKTGSSGTLKNVMGKVTNNPFIGFILGLLVTCLVQSSTATIVLTSGLVGAGVLTLHQSLGIIIGANVGTTITGQIIRLLDINADAASFVNLFKPATLAPLAAIIGIIMIMVVKAKNSKTIGNIAIGFAVLFTGLINMTAAVEPLSNSPAFAEIFLKLADKPILGFLAGAMVALLIQSSSASVGILQALSMTGQLTFGGIYAIILGIYLGDCITTAIVCSIGARADSKRVGVVHIAFNLSGTILVFIIVAILRRAGLIDELWLRSISSGGIANANTVFKLGGAIVLLPLAGMFEKLSRKIVKDDKTVEKRGELAADTLETVFFSSPAIALASVKSVVTQMATIGCKNVEKAMRLLTDFDEKTVQEINDDEEDIDTLADHASQYLLQLSPHITLDKDNDQMNYYIKCVNEWERIGDLAVNIAENAQALKERGIRFSNEAEEELTVISTALYDITQYARDAFDRESIQISKHVEPLEEVIDDLVAILRENHLRRLRDGNCNIYSGFIFLDALTNIERVSDQCSNLGIYTISRYDLRIADMKHDYVKELHQGADPEYTAEYNEQRGIYVTRLSEVEARYAASGEA